MKLNEVFDSGKNRVFTATDVNYGIQYSFVVKYYGKDVNGFDLWHGKMKQGSNDPVEITLVVEPDGKIVAANTQAPLEAIKHIFASKRRGYGPSNKPERSFIWRHSGVKLEDYE